MAKHMISKLAAWSAAATLLLSACGTGGTPAAQEGAAPETAAQESAVSQESGQPGGEEVELTISHFHLEEQRDTNAPADIFLTLAAQWQEANPNVSIVQVPMTQADYSTKIQAQAAVNELPDIFYLKGSWTANFANSGLMKPLNNYVDAYEHKSDFREGVFDASTRDGQIYGIPNQLTISSVVYYNRDMWASVGYDAFPDTWDNLLDGIEKLSAQGITPIALGNKDIWPAESTILSNLGDRLTGPAWTNGIIENDGSASFTDPDFVKALEYLQALAQAGAFNPDYNTISNTQAEELYSQGMAAATIDGHWALGYIETNATDEVLGSTGVSKLPPVPGGKGDANTLSGGCGWYISLSDKLEGAALDAAVDFVFATNGYELSVLNAEKYGLAGPSIVGNVDMSGFTPLTVEYAQFTSGVNLTPVYDLYMDGAVIEVMNTGLQELLNGTKSPEDLAAQIQAEQDNVKS